MLPTLALILTLLSQTYATTLVDRPTFLSTITESCLDLSALPRLESILCELESVDELDAEVLQAAVSVSPAPGFGVVADMLIACGAVIEEETLMMALERLDGSALNILLAAISFDNSYEDIIQNLFKRLMELATETNYTDIASVLRVLERKGLQVDLMLIELCVERRLLGLIPELSSMGLPITPRALRLAIRQDDLEATDLLLRLGANPNALMNQSSMLSYAIQRSSSPAIIALLLFSGAVGRGADIVQAYAVGRGDIAALLQTRGVELELMEQFQIMLMMPQEHLSISV